MVARFNGIVTGYLLDGAQEALRRHGVADDDVDVAWVPGSFEIPLVAKRLAETGRYDAVICIGAVIRGETDHYDHVAGVGDVRRGAGRAGHGRPDDLRRADHGYGGAGAEPVGPEGRQQRLPCGRRRHRDTSLLSQVARRQEAVAAR